ncbi:magnesium transporter CorA family protein [candidate division WOR-3 bacterium]|uniref:Magnesium transporter CorA family protein n=1 Tax=candidate division WOR-3 bacterium TaxID=2052148 RepID=A0A938BPT2_UNCW3|nr:magnesium transporter CorA family protein [candidate division WOR-3 bacterium]
MLKTYAIHDSRVVETPGGPISVYLAPDEAERRFLVESCRIDEHTLASALDPDELARLEFEPDHVAVIFKRPRNYSGQDGVLFKVASCGVFLFRDRLIVVQAEDLPLFEGKLFLRIATLPEILLKLINRSIFHFLEHLKIINTISSELEQKINQAMENRQLINLFGLEKSLVYYVASLNSNGTVIDKLKLNTTKIGFSPEEGEFLDDITIENSQCSKQAEIYSNILAGLMDARVSIVSNNLNLLIKTLNIITIAIMVPTLVVSIFSMNVKLPIAENHPLAFWAIMGMAGAALAVFMYAWWRKKW